jgi:hypothetical protein
MDRLTESGDIGITVAILAVAAFLVYVMASPALYGI